MVQCVKYGRELPGLARPPYPGELGERIFNEVSQIAWDAWMQHSVILINHYGLSLGDPRAREFLKEQMDQFFFSPGTEEMPEGWTPEGMPPAAPAKGAPPRK
jgi:Fe-S cluster biosynthesis and repair protein YggX